MKEAEFKCKYAAAYMMEHFGISIMVDDGKSEFQCYGGGTLFIEDRTNGNCPGRILVDPEGPWPFEPEAGDICLVMRRQDELIPVIMLSEKIPDDYELVTILSRNGKSFIMPEIR